VTWLVVSVVAVLVIDQVTKRLVTNHLAVGQAWPVARTVAIRRVEGGAWPRSSTRTPWPWLGLWTVSAVASALYVLYSPRAHGPAVTLALGAALGGAAGNLVDRVWRGRVVDFVAIWWWPAFNVADVGITAGVLVTLWLR
jgi:signal peptidase II